MRKHLKWAASMGAVAVALVLSGCERSEGVLEPGVSRSVTAAVHSSTSPGSAYRLAKGHVPETITERTKEVVIGKSGGRFAVAGHELRIPANAVDQPTIFRMQVLDDGHVSLDLRAYRIGAGGETIDVGAKGFKRRVTLVMKNIYVTEDVDKSTLAIVWVQSDGTLVPAVATWADNNTEDVYAQLEHFSQWALAWP